MTPEDRITQTTAALHAAALELGMTISPDCRVSEADAAVLLELSQGALRNLRALAIGPAFYNRGVGAGGRISYRLADLAGWIEQARREY